MKRKLLISALALLSMLGIAGVVQMFWSSLGPSEKAYADIPRFRVPGLKPDEFAYIKDPTALDNWPADLLLLRRHDGSLKVWRIPTRNGVHLLPDIHWWQVGNACPRFEPNIQSGVIECVGLDLGEWGRKNYRWNLDGKNIAGLVDDLWEIKGREDGNEFVLGSRR